MSAEVKILIEGYTNADSVSETGKEKTQATITLVRDGDVIMVVDPGVLESQQLLIDALAKENLTVKDVNVVCVTHSHIDHCRNVGMFPDAKVLEYFGLWNKDAIEEWPEVFSPNIRVVHTPGHDYTGITLLVTTASDCEHPGVVAICGDVFWKENYPRNPHDDPYASNPEQLEASREMILKMSDFIIPGHGGIYKSDISAFFSQEVPEKNTNIVIVGKCKKCGKEMQKRDRCRCRPYLCIKHCECGFDCQTCGCSHKVYQKT